MLNHGIICPSRNRTVIYAIVVAAYESFAEPTKVRYFKVNSSGVITVSRNLPDFVEASVHSLIVDARYRDSVFLASYGRVVIKVVDINNNDPIWPTQYDYITEIKENIKAGQTIVTVTAEDADNGSNAELRYFLRYPGVDPFDLDPVTGVINTTMQLDRETKDQYVFEIYAEDMRTYSSTECIQTSYCYGGR